MVMLGVTCIKIGLFTAAAVRLGRLYCVGGKDGGDRATGKAVPLFPAEGWQSLGREGARFFHLLCSRDPPGMHSSLLGRASPPAPC